MKLTVVGAGLCGLQIATAMRENQIECVVLEKSRAVGGRMATRRSGDAKFDHGAQFYSLKGPLRSLDQRWRAAGLSQNWYVDKGVERVRSKDGMTALAKNLAQGLETRFEHKVVRLERGPNAWWVQLENQPSFLTDNIVLTCPLPQSLALLEASHLAYPSDLKNVVYAKAVVALIEEPRGLGSLLEPHGISETPAGTQIFTCVDQQRKGVSPSPALTLTMNPEFSARHYESADADILESILTELRKWAPQFDYKNAQLKKWRYSHPLKIYSAPFVTVAEGLSLAGDAFGGPSLNGAVTSATHFVQHHLKPFET